MKVMLMKKTPKITDVHQQSMLYENHKKKLNKIREDRKLFLGFDNHRLTQIESIKMTKSKSFASKFNQNSKHIETNNNHMLNKLLQVKNRPNTYRGPIQLQERSQSHSLIRSLAKKQMQMTTTQNRRLLERLEKIESPLSARKFNSEYLKTERIRKRIQRYTANDDKISLKSQRSYDNMKKSNISIQGILQRNRQKTIENEQRLKSLSSKKKTFNFVNHYRKDDILNNKIDVRMDKQINSARKQIKQGGVLNNIVNDQKMFGMRFKNQGYGNKTNSFLTLQPQKKNTLPVRRKFN